MFWYRHFQTRPWATPCLMGVSPDRRYVVRSSPLRGVRALHPARDDLDRPPPLLRRRSTSKTNLVTWLPSLYSPQKVECFTRSVPSDAIPRMVEMGGVGINAHSEKKHVGRDRLDPHECPRKWERSLQYAKRADS